MPRESLRAKVLGGLDDLSLAAAKCLDTNRLLGLPAADAELLLHRLCELKMRARSRRHLFPRGSHRRRTPEFHTHLETDHGDSTTDKEFKTFFRMERDSFWQLVQLLESHGLFHRRNSDSRGADPQPCAHQLLVLLRFFGCEGNAASSIALGNFFGVASGATDTHRNQALAALLSIEKDTYFWPDAEERRQMAKRTEHKWPFKHCVGLIDGTLLPLSSRPCVHGQTHLSRKKFCAVVMLIVCDDAGRILHCHVGWPGSVHDNRVWRNCSVFTKCQDFFSPKQCLLGDSAFVASQIMTPPCESTAGSNLSRNKTEFNTLLAKPRVKSEHCIGTFKGRLPFFKSIRLKIKSEGSMKRLVNCVSGGVTPHNFLLNDAIEDDWIEHDNYNSPEDLMPENEIDKNGNQPDYSRREEICCCLSELEDTNVI